MAADCPSCGEPVASPTSSWTMKGRVAGDPTRHNTVTISQYNCPACGKAFRKGEPQT